MNLKKKKNLIPLEDGREQNLYLKKMLNKWKESSIKDFFAVQSTSLDNQVVHEGKHLFILVFQLLNGK